MAEHSYRQGGFGEEYPWQVAVGQLVVLKKGSPSVCKHCVLVEDKLDSWYNTYKCRAAVVAHNQGGFDSTEVCLDCILEAAASLTEGEPA